MAPSSADGRQGGIRVARIIGDVIEGDVPISTQRGPRRGHAICRPPSSRSRHRSDGVFESFGLHGLCPAADIEIGLFGVGIDAIRADLGPPGVRLRK
jgi:hypothetical protein